MSFFSFFRGEKKKSAAVAKERLQLILTREHSGRGGAADYLPQLQKELVAVIAKFVKINPEDVKVNIQREDDLEVLEVKIEMPAA
jgi:cell division topological specificity factor